MRRLAAALVSAGLVAGCSPVPVSSSVRPEWRESVLPVSSGTALVRAAVECRGSWFVAGGIRESSGATRPAVWSSADALSWSPVELSPVSFYGVQSVLSAVACAGGRLVLLGAKSGGVHGNPRVSSWVGPIGGPVREVSAPFELFGGAEAVNAGRMRSGPAGFVIVGNRVSGASVWSSADGAEFVLAPGAGGRSWASDAVPLSGDRWLVVGAVRAAGVRSPAAWSWDPAAGWSDVPVEAMGAGEAQWAGPVLLGVSSGEGFRAWRPVDDRWVAGPVFGKAPLSSPPATVSGAMVDGGVVALSGSGGAYRLWLSGDSGGSWSELVPPVVFPRSVESFGVIAGAGNRLLLGFDGGSGARVFSAPGPFTRSLR